MEDIKAPEATSETENKVIVIEDNGMVTWAHFKDKPEYESLCEFHGWNSQRQIYFHLVNQGYKNIISNY